MNDTLRFDTSKIKDLADEYIRENKDQNEDEIVKILGPRSNKNGFYNQEDFLKICRWKTPRTQPRCAANDELYIREVTMIALKTQHERLRIEVLTLLNGVGWPTASVLLHFGHKERYPILDFRALESLGIDQPLEYTFPFWWNYVQICRKIADECCVDMRTLDRALWQLSKNQSKGPVGLGSS